jgi:protein-S-isoprenylcysteine O-methyltransferase Ste14
VLLLRSLFFAILIPGMMVGLIPYWVAGEEARRRPWDALGWLALVPLSIGIAVLGACIRDFLAVGQGTLAPIDPPKHLVRAGLYRYVRNPMYLGALLVLIAQTLLFQSSALVLYTLLWFGAVNAMVYFYEEPHLRREFGEPYAGYCRTVRRWVPRWPV